MQTGKFNVLLDGFWGSSGKGKMATWLADKFSVTNVSSSNFPNAGHTARFTDGTTFVAKAIPTAAILKKARGMGMTCWLSPGSGFSWERLALEWAQAGKPRIYVHGRASIVTEDHARREREGAESTKHVASTMQGSGAAIADKVLRRPGCLLAWNDDEAMKKAFQGLGSEDRIAVVDPAAFRDMTWSSIEGGSTWLHEGSQGFALSIDHGSHYPFCLSGDSKVVMADGTTKKIKNIRAGDLVSSMGQDGRAVTRKVLNFWERETGSRKWYNVVTETSIYNDHDKQWIGPKLTGDHKIRTQRGVVRVDELRRGDSLYVNEDELCGDSLQVFLGSMLGDGTVPECWKNKRRAVFSFTHGEKQAGYARAKAAIMRSHIEGHERTIRYGVGSFKEGNVCIRYESGASMNVMRRARALGCYGKKDPDMRAIVEHIDGRGLAIWYQDDGQYKHATNGNEVYLHTNGFSKESVSTLASALEEKFGVHFSVYAVKGVKKYGRGEKEYPVLRLARGDHEKWFEMISRYVHKDLTYKLPDGHVGSWSTSWTDSGESQCAMEVVLDVVRSRDFRGMDKCYDIEVDETHNFFVKNDKGAFNVENCTSRNCTMQAAMDHMAIPPRTVGDVYLNLRTFPIRVGNVVEDGKQVGFSGDFYPDCRELTWEQVAAESGMPDSEAKALAERERTTVTKRIRRVCNFSYVGLKDAVRVNGATKLILNFVQYLDWADYGLRGGRDVFQKLSRRSREMIDKIEETSGVPVALIGTGADHEDVISLL